MFRETLRGALVAGLVAAAALPSGALAVDNRERARAQIAETKGKLEVARSEAPAAVDAAQRAQRILDEAQRQFEKNNNDNAYYAAREAESLVELALAHGGAGPAAGAAVAPKPR